MLRSLLGVFLLLISSGLSAQNIEHLLEQMDIFWNHNPQEKIYVHTDRSAYTAGETLWFKMYNTIGIENNLSILSNINYIELIDPRDQIVEDQIIAMSTGVGNGNIILADTLVEGTYRLRAYTNWMQNYASDYFFETKIVVTNGRTDNVLTQSTRVDEANDSYYTVTLTTLAGTPLSKTSVRYQFIEDGNVVDRGSTRTDESGLLSIKVNNKNKGRALTLSFTNIDKRNVSKVIHTNLFDSENSLQAFPEGGHLLAGHLNKLAVKALKPNGLGIKAVIDILDGQNNTVSSIETNDLGMGTLSFFPNHNEQYTLKAKFDDGTEQDFDMPEIKTSGMSLIVNNQTSGRLYAQVSASEDMLSGSELFFVVHHLGQVFYVSKQKMDKTSMVFSLPKEDLPKGILTISILNESYAPVFERPFFNESSSKALPLTATTSKSVFSTREKIETQLTVGDAQDTIRIAALSAAVVNMDKLTDTTDLHANILSALLLEADVKGHIESPGYYFDKDGAVKAAELDNLLLAQGWRKIVWEELSQAETEEKEFEAEKSLSIKGHTRKLGRKVAAPHSTVQLISTDNLMNFLDTTATEDGYFVFDNLIFPDSIQFLISAKDEKGRNNIDIITEEKITPPIDVLQGGANDLNNLYSKAVTESKRFFNELERKGLMANTIDIEEVVVTRTVKKVPDHSTNMNGPGNADQVLGEEDLELCSTLEMCLNGRLMGVVFRNGVPYNTRGMVPMQIMLDGMAIEGDMLSTIPVMDVASVEVLRNVNYTAIYGMHGGNGVLVITTKIGSSRRDYTPKGLLSLQPKGFSFATEFYKPIYEVDSEQVFANDLRTTIHWEPMITTGEEGNTSFDFYTSDEPGTYRIIIEGLDLYGRIGRKIIDVEVKK